MIEVAFISTDKIVSEIEETFIDNFHEIPTIVRAPSRVSFIGEHMDYNKGFILTSAINQALYVAIGPNEDSTVTKYIYLDAEEPNYEGDIHNLEKTNQKWPNYINGIVDQLVKKGSKISGFNCVIKGNIPAGSGMSMYAALECSIIFALNEVFELKMDKMAMALLAQKGENEFVGVHSGILNFFTIMFSKKNYAIQLDCRSMEYKYVHIRMDDYRIVVFDSGANRMSGVSEYNRKREAFEHAVGTIKKLHPHVDSMRDVTHGMLDNIIKPISEDTYLLCRYVVEELQRIQDACEDLTHSNLFAFGKKMFASHEALRTQLRASCAELDFLIDFVKNESGVIGARMMGAELGASTVNLIKERDIQDIIPRISQAFEKKMGRELKVYVYETGGGISQIQ